MRADLPEVFADRGQCIADELWAELSPEARLPDPADAQHELDRSKKLFHGRPCCTLAVWSTSPGYFPWHRRTAGSCSRMRSRSSGGTRTKRCARPGEQPATTAD